MKDIKLRELRGDDMFPLLNILSVIDITDEVVEMMQGGGDLKLPNLPVLDAVISSKLANSKELSKAESKTLDAHNKELVKVTEERKIIIEKNAKRNLSLLIRKLLANIQLVKTEINVFIGSLCDMTSQEVGQLKFARYIQLIMEVFNQPEILELFTSAAGSTPNVMESPASETVSTEDTMTH